MDSSCVLHINHSWAVETEKSKVILSYKKKLVPQYVMYILSKSVLSNEDQTPFISDGHPLDNWSGTQMPTALYWFIMKAVCEDC